jgi:hypothetical protein
VLIKSLHEGGKNCTARQSGVDIRQLDESSFELTQPFLVKQITKFLGLKNGKTNDKLTPVGKPLLNKDLDGVPQKYN